MTSKERVQCAFAHKQPDKVPIDFGGMSCSQMHITIVDKLRKYYGLEKRPIKLWDVFGMTGLIDDDLKDAIGTDVEMIKAFGGSFGIQDTGKWKEYRMFGVDLLVPEQFEVSEDGKGGFLIYPQGDRSAPPSGHMPAGGFYFDNLERQQEIDEDNMDPAENLEEYTKISEAALAYYSTEIEKYRGSKRAIVLDPGGAALGDASQIAGPGLKHPKGIRSVADWYMAPLLYPDYVHEIFERQTDLVLDNWKQLYDIAGDAVDIIYVCGTDFGSQTSQMCSPATFDEFYMPYYRKINQWVHGVTNWHTLKHSCGAIYPFIPKLIEVGFDSLNPVQCSANGMDPQRLKDEFGDHILYWGGGVDTQKVLPFGTPQQVRKQVLQRCDIFSKGGGYIFNSIHIVQCNTPIENVVAMIDAVHEFNGDK